MFQPMNTSSANNITLENPPVSEETKASSQDSVLWTTKEVAKYLHVSLKTVFNLRKRGLPFVQLGGAIRFVPQEIRDYLVNSRGLSSHRSRQIARKGGAL
jgi:excisionase family DNA binding protein